MRALAAILWVFTSLTTAAADPVKVGCLYPLSGSGGLYGRDSLVAIDMALEDIRQSNTPIEIEVAVRDSRSKTLRSLQIARNFVETDGVDFLCGMVSSTVALTVSDYARKSATFLIGTDHASPTLVSSQLHPYYFRVTNGSRLSMRAGAMYIAETQPKTPLRISFVGPDYDYGYQVFEDLRHFLEAEGVAHEISSVYWPALFASDYSLYIQQLIEDAPDIVVNAHWGLDLVTFVRQADQLGLFETVQFMNFDTGGNYEILAELGADMPEGLVLSARHHLNWPATAANDAFVTEFHARAGRYPSYAAEGAYSGIMAIAEAVRQAGGTQDKEKLKQALENLKLSLPEDPDGFRSTMDPKHHQMLQVQAIGRTEPSQAFPPAQMILGDIRVYEPPLHWPDRPVIPQQN
ncbi:ABC transporter substrate-binding protein [Epibacterium sp. SM1979]|uniref:ABC transporter substrate-binding protein n=1 Tax=Tritonibacter litoralis TaxID=2662264 RepID=A0A843Y8A0_9RHOB|nr:ABC transporter substrate-binding protein [Tritonibacter litoralis]MQQ07096.1 ABC transporter substrate-binding protein [Tritonibacter litoralis]